MREAATICPRLCKLTFDLLTLKVVTESRDVGYLCANFSLPRPLRSRRRPDVRDRQTSDVRRASSLNASARWGRGIITYIIIISVFFTFRTRVSSAELMYGRTFLMLLGVLSSARLGFRGLTPLYEMAYVLRNVRKWFARVDYKLPPANIARCLSLPNPDLPPLKFDKYGSDRLRCCMFSVGDEASIVKPAPHVH